jgi:hypothetical protein
MTSTSVSPPVSSTRRVLLAGVAAAVPTGVLSAAIALASASLGVPQIPQLTPAAVALFSVFGAIVGAFGWQAVRRRATDPGRTMRWLVPFVLVVSFVPDVLLAFTLASTTGVAPVLALALMHITTLVIGVTVYSRLLPVRSR